MNIIDIHTHTFPEKIVDKSIAALEKAAAIKAFHRGTNDSLKESMEKNGITYSVLMPVATSVKQVESINSGVYEINETATKTGIFSFGAMHPDYENYEEMLHELASHKVKGIKLHPDYQRVDFDDIKIKRIISKACEFGLMVLTHAGVDIGIPYPARCTPDRVLDVLKDTGCDNLILAHMGGWRLWPEVTEKLFSQKVYIDTSFSMDNILGVDDLLSTQEYEKMIEKFGAKKVLFGTDSPWGSQKDSFDFVNGLNISKEDKEDIFFNNANRFMKID